MKKLKLFLAISALAIVAGVAFVSVTNVVEAHTRTVKIAVSKHGFSPSSIEVETGHKLNLVFTRSDGNNCSVVVIPSMNIRKALPLNKDVIASFTPTSPGEITFSCGSGAHKGKLIVSEG